jgi:site-specific recombinase XerD
MKNTFNIIFYTKKTKPNREGKFPIYARITINGTRLELSTNRATANKNLEIVNGKIKGSSDETNSLNAHLQSFRHKLYNQYRELIDKKILVNATSLKNLVYGIEEKKKTVLELFSEHNKQVKERIGKEYALATYKRFETTQNHFQKFLQHRYKMNDIHFDDLNMKLLNDFDYYLKTVNKCNHNSALKYVKLFKKIVRLAVSIDLLVKDPFMNFKSKVQEVERDFLTWNELKTIEEKEFTIGRLDLVRDLFVFSCYTGLAYIDMATLSLNDIKKEQDGEMWLQILRTKTKGRSQILLLPKALETIEKYKNYPVNCAERKLLPAFSNQKMNAYLKEIADLCKVKKHLTFHSARHTFATTVTLSNGVPIETVSSMLGHKNIRTTQIYARILKDKIGVDMKALKAKLISNDKS